MRRTNRGDGHWVARERGRGGLVAVCVATACAATVCLATGCGGEDATGSGEPAAAIGALPTSQVNGAPTSGTASGVVAGAGGTPGAAGVGSSADPATAPSNTAMADGAAQPSDGASNVAAGSTEAPSAEAPADPFAGLECTQPKPGRAPLRRLTRFEFNKTLSDLLGDDTLPGNSLPAELLGNGFGNDADEQPSSSFLVEQYGLIAEAAAARALASPETLQNLEPCLASVGEQGAGGDQAAGEQGPGEDGCVRAFVEKFVPRAYRRPLEVGEVDELLALFASLREHGDFTSSIAGLIETLLQSPDFLYRIERGQADATQPARQRPTGHEMASRLSYLFWGTMPDAELVSAAESGALASADGVLAQANRLLADVRSRDVIRFFTDRYLPLGTLGDLSRDPAQYPTFTPGIGNAMREETHRFLEYEIFEGPGDWPSALSAPYSFLNEELANFYGVPGVVGPEFRKVELDPARRLGLLTHGSVMVGTTVSNFTNPVRRGSFFLRKILCIEVPDPPAEFEDIMPPDPYSGATARERYSAHSRQPECAGCHAVLDPTGFALENFDAVGLWRDAENDVPIDASGDLATIGAFSGPIELVQKIAQSHTTQECFAENWMTFAYGRALDAADDCTEASVKAAFIDSGYDVQALLLALTQSDAFLFLPNQVQESIQ